MLPSPGRVPVCVGVWDEVGVTLRVAVLLAVGVRVAVFVAVPVPGGVEVAVLLTLGVSDPVAETDAVSEPVCEALPLAVIELVLVIELVTPAAEIAKT